MPQQLLERIDLMLKYLDVDNVLSSLNLPNLSQSDQDVVNLTIALVKAVKQHEEYIQNLIKLVRGEIEWNPPSYTQCKFGQTYYKIDIKTISKYGDEVVNIFKRIGTLHAEFHSISEDLIRASTVEEKKMIALELASKSKVLIDTIVLLVNKLSNQLHHIS